MTRRGYILPIAAATLLGLGTIGAAKFMGLCGERADCPGKIACPLTGEDVCRDQCPTVDPDRADCPGRIVCPITGELVCRDRCPLGKKAKAADATEATSAITAADKDAAVPSCCSKT